MPSPKFDYLNVELSRRLNDVVSDATNDGKIYTSQRRSNYLNQAMQYITKYVYNLVQTLSQNQELKNSIYFKILPDLIVIETIQSQINPARIEFNKLNIQDTIFLIKTNDSKYFTPLSPYNYHIALSNYNTLYKFTIDNPAFTFINNKIYILPDSYPQSNFNVTYFANPIKTNGTYFNANDTEDIPFSSRFYEQILMIAQAFALFDNREIDRGEFYYRISLTEMQLIGGFGNAK